MDLPKIDIQFPLTGGDEGNDVEILTYNEGVCLTVLQGGMITHQITLTKDLILTVEKFRNREVIDKHNLQGDC